MRPRSALGSVQLSRTWHQRLDDEGMTLICSTADIKKLHSKIGQLVVERGLWPMPRFNGSGREAKNGEQGS